MKSKKISIEERYEQLVPGSMKKIPDVTLCGSDKYLSGVDEIIDDRIIGKHYYSKPQVKRILKSAKNT